MRYKLGMPSVFPTSDLLLLALRNNLYILDLYGGVELESLEVTLLNFG